MKRILLTGMSGTGKSTVITALAALGYKAVDLDSDEYSHWIVSDPEDTLTPEPGRDWVWQEDRVQELLLKEDDEQLFVSGCAENMGRFLPQFDHIILLSAHPDVLVNRLSTRTNNDFGKEPQQLANVLTLQQTIEPLLRQSAGHEIDTNAPLNDIITRVLQISSL